AQKFGQGLDSGKEAPGSPSSQEASGRAWPPGGRLVPAWTGLTAEGGGSTCADPGTLAGVASSGGVAAGADSSETTKARGKSGTAAGAGSSATTMARGKSGAEVPGCGPD